MKGQRERERKVCVIKGVPLFNSRNSQSTICHWKSIELQIIHPHSITTNITPNLVFQERRRDLLGQMAPQDLQDLQDPRDPQGFQGFLEFQEQLLWDHLALQVLLVLKDPLASRDLLVNSCSSTLPQAPLPVL